MKERKFIKKYWYLGILFLLVFLCSVPFCQQKYGARVAKAENAAILHSGVDGA